MGKASSKHDVTCAVCGRKGRVAVGKGGHIADNKWSFFGRFSVNFDQGELLYRDNNEEELSAEFPNPVEYWECENCFRDNEQMLGKAR